MKCIKRTIYFSVLLLAAINPTNLTAQTDTIEYLFMGHPRYDDYDHEYVHKTIEKIDYSKFDLLLLGGDLTWSTSGKTSTLDYCDAIFDFESLNSHIALGNHDIADVASLLSYTQKDRFYCFSKNNLTFIVLDTEISTPDITGTQLDLVKQVADTIKNSDYLILIHHRILWMVNNPDLAHLNNTVAGSTRSLTRSNFFDEVYPELQKVKNKGIPVYCIAGDRTNSNIEYSKEEDIQFIASGMVGTYPDENNYAVVLTHFPEKHTLDYKFVPLSEMDTLSENANLQDGNVFNFNIYPNPGSDRITIQLSNQVKAVMKAEIFSLQGTELLEIDLSKHQTTYLIDASDFATGYYYIRISNNQTSLTKRLFVFNNSFSN